LKTERREKRRRLQLEVIKSLAGFFEKNVCWLAGGWAVEAITGVRFFHDDIDLYFLDEFRGLLPAENDFLDIHIVSKKPDGSYRQVTMGEVLRFSSHAFELKPRIIAGLEVRTVSPELLFAFADGSPDPRFQEKRTLRLLRGINMEKVGGIIQYLPEKSIK